MTTLGLLHPGAMGASVGAAAVAAHGFAGLYLDANAISPASARAIAATVEGGGARFLDGGIVGPPAWRAHTTRLYLAGEGAGAVAGLFAGSALETVVLSGGVGAASALKMSYAAWTKGSAALLLAVRALARAEGVEAALLSEWNTSLPELPKRSERTAERVTPKAWRFAGEMREIADSFWAAGLPDGFHRAAEALYGRLSDFKDEDTAAFDEVMAALLAP